LLFFPVFGFLLLVYPTTSYSSKSPRYTIRNPVLTTRHRISGRTRLDGVYRQLRTWIIRIRFSDITNNRRLARVQITLIGCVLLQLPHYKRINTVG
jgi:hypothetical protein